MLATPIARRGWRQALARAAHWVLARVDEREPPTSEPYAPLPPPVSHPDVAICACDLERTPAWDEDTIDLDRLDERFHDFMGIDGGERGEERWLLGL